MVEVVFPCCAICRLQDRDVRNNMFTMSRLHSGYLYKVAGTGTDDDEDILIAGSKAEGLALGSHWGHPYADRDSMTLYGHTLGVYIPGGHTTRGSASLEYHPEGCPPAYCKLEVIDLIALRKELNSYASNWWEKHIAAPRCTPRAGGRHWLNTYRTVRLLKNIDESDQTVSGPAVQFGLNEYITTLVCSGPHPDLQREFRQRSRQQWPPAHIIEYLLMLPTLLVLVGHKLSKNFKREARISWSHCEIKIIQELPESIRQGYIACKYVLKCFLAVHRGQTGTGDGRSRVGSYHLKTVFLRYLEKRPPQMITSPFGLFIDLLNDLDHYLEVGKLPHYFLSECDLLVTMDSEERRIARQAIQAILSDPLAALLTSPTDPLEIYGEVHPDALVNCFRRVINHPMCQQSWKDLSVLLVQVDECRHKCYKRQREWDEQMFLPVSGRPELTGLVEALKQIKNSWYNRTNNFQLD